MLPQERNEPRFRLNSGDLFRRGDWAIDLNAGYAFHKHRRKDYGVFNHYWSKEQGWPDRPLILICSYCKIQIPDKEYQALHAAYRLLKKPWK